MQRTASPLSTPMSRRLRSLLAAGSAWLLVGLAVALSLVSVSAAVVPSGNATEPSGNATEPCDDGWESGPDDAKVCLVRTWPWPCIGCVLGAALAGFLAMFFTLPCLLAALGFGVIGITAGSIAACFQSSHGTPATFRCMQSTAMLDTRARSRFWLGLVGLVAGAWIAAYWVPMCFAEKGSALYGLGNYTDDGAAAVESVGAAFTIVKDYFSNSNDTSA